MSDDLNETDVKHLPISEHEDAVGTDSPNAAVIVIPPEVLGQATGDNVALTIYQDDALFVWDSVEESDDRNLLFKVNSKVISASMEFDDFGQKFDVPIKISLAHIEVC